MDTGSSIGFWNVTPIELTAERAPFKNVPLHQINKPAPLTAPHSIISILMLKAPVVCSETAHHPIAPYDNLVWKRISERGVSSAWNNNCPRLFGIGYRPEASSTKPGFDVGLELLHRSHIEFLSCSPPQQKTEADCDRQGHRCGVRTFGTRLLVFHLYQVVDPYFCGRGRYLHHPIGMVIDSSCEPLRTNKALAPDAGAALSAMLSVNPRRSVSTLTPAAAVGIA